MFLRTSVNPKGGNRVEKPAEPLWAVQGKRRSGLPSVYFPKSGSYAGRNIDNLRYADTTTLMAEK